MKGIRPQCHNKCHIVYPCTLELLDSTLNEKSWLLVGCCSTMSGGYTEHTNCHGGLDVLLTALNICMSILDLRVFAVWIFIDTLLR